jgi:site-specific recombinase XerD
MRRSAGQHISHAAARTQSGCARASGWLVAVEALRKHRKRPAAEQLQSGGKWQDHDLVFCREDGTPLDRWQVRCEFGVITKEAGGEAWAPREPRHSFVSILSASGVRIEDISDLMGQAANGHRVRLPP